MDEQLQTLLDSADHVSIFKYPFYTFDGDSMEVSGVKIQIEVGSKAAEPRQTVYGVGETTQDAWEDAMNQVETA